MKKQNMYEIGIVVASIILAILFSNSIPGQTINLKIYDMFSTIKPKPKEWDKLLYVDVDDQSIDIIGTWPIPRRIQAKGIEVLKELGADKILLDIEYIDPSTNTLDLEYYSQLVQNSQLSQNLSKIQDKLIYQPDQVLAKTMAEGGKNVYVACHGVNETKKKRTDISQDASKELQWISDNFFLPIKDKKLVGKIPADKYLETPVFPIYGAVKSIGFAAIDKDVDGALRKVHLFRIFGNYLVPQLAIPVLIDELDIDRDNIEIKPGDYIKFVTKDKKKTIKVPITPDGQMYVNWSKPWKATPFGNKGMHIPFSALIEYDRNKQMLAEQMSYLRLPGLTAEDQAAITENIVQLQRNLADLKSVLSVIKGKITITGLTSTSSSDIGPITIDPASPLVLLQANVINTIYQQQFLMSLPLWGNIFILVLLCGLVFFLSWRIQSASRELFVSGIFLILLMVVSYGLLAVFGIIQNYIMLITGSFLALIGFTAFKFILYDRQKNYIKKAFMQYLSPEVVKEVIANPDLLKLGGERREITAYFSDVAGFTSLSEKLSPEEVVSLLNKYLTAMTDIILEHGGTVDKYEGDAIVAFFGAPIPYQDHALRCCNAAVDMQNALVTLRQKWMDEGYPSITVRMGLNTGPAIIGNMGSQQRMDYTMMGDTVNSASRFEGANKAYGTYTMISESTYNYVKDKFVTRKLDLLRVVGKSQPVAVYELIGRIGEVPDDKVETVELYHKALEQYNSRNWSEGAEMFKEIVRKYKDAPSQTYYERCIKFKKTPPADDWDGVFVLKSK